MCNIGVFIDILVRIINVYLILCFYYIVIEKVLNSKLIVYYWNVIIIWDNKIEKYKYFIEKILIIKIK